MAISLSNLATPTACQYKNQKYDFTCDELAIDTGSKFCIFHDINYLKATHDSLHYYHKEQVVKRLEEKLSEYYSSTMPLKFIGYFLPDISFQNKQFTEELYFNDATFYGIADFTYATFSNETNITNFSVSKFLRDIC